MTQAKESKPVSNTASQPLPPFPPPGSCPGWPTTSCKWKEVVSSPSCFLVTMFYHSNRESETGFCHCCCWLSLGHADRRDMLEPLEVGPKTMCKMSATTFSVHPFLCEFGVSDPKCDPGELRRASLSSWSRRKMVVDGESAFGSEVHSQVGGFQKRMLDIAYQGLDSP